MYEKDDEFSGLTYPQRHALMVERGSSIEVFVPRADTDLGVAPKSGIVGRNYFEDEDDKVLLDYEGWVKGAMQYEGLNVRGQWEAAVKHAAGRAFVRYPTIARRLADRADLIEVGTYTAAGVLTVTDEAAVQAWLRR